MKITILFTLILIGLTSCIIGEADDPVDSPVTTFYVCDVISQDGECREIEVPPESITLGFWVTGTNPATFNCNTSFVSGKCPKTDNIGGCRLPYVEGGQDYFLTLLIYSNHSKASQIDAYKLQCGPYWVNP